MFIDTIVPAPILGAQRTLDITWPGILGLRPNNGSAVGAIAHMTRQGAGQPLQNTSGVALIGAGSAFQWGTGTGYLGRAAGVLRPGHGAPPVGMNVQLDPMVLTPTFGPSTNQNDGSQTDDWACWRCYGILSFQPQVSYAADMGMVWVCLNAGNSDLTNGAKGFGFLQTSDTQISFSIAPALGGGIGTTSVVFTGNVQLWNTYEIRIIGATPANNAVLKVFVNGRRVISYDWVTAGLPDPQHSNLQYGFLTMLNAHASGVGGDASGFAINKARFIVGPTEASLL